ncbi:Glycosyltransferase, catalytic subunit of cellulose synthase and poly-beta-1,6-N-acetylglucosamine synthase [Cribrihabitans marinus]|uniref:Chitooligosaccharide deacetylase n=1 Tax=Cribrihabitans marinus TaxID=1227549 RepID=A0A1H6Y6W1_9RHOB|nr:glycosyltransferase [Cribrihabitans marinus]GGH28591.1 glycosyl transferase family 2 [Cribrihabitans marinus]SEJ36206.1 Glycosyltransferase, catalytic subunit of cellulose synthase and poly-beta-1,6-N-acetylglucosamine synthase [Cribrihabitans marinus]
MALASSFFILLGLWVAGLTLSVLMEQGPQGQNLVARNAHTPGTQPLFDFETDGAVDLAVVEPHSHDHAAAAPQGCTKGVTPGRAGFQNVFATVPVQLEWMETSLAQACDAVDVVMPEWYHLDDAGLRTLANTAPAADNGVTLDGLGTGYQAMPVVRVPGDAPDALVHLTEPDSRARLVRELARVTTFPDHAGVCVDLSALPVGQLGSMGTFVSEFARAVSDTGRDSCIALGADALDGGASGLLDITDRVLVKAFRHRLDSGTPTPVSGRDWYRDTLAAATTAISPERLVLMLGAGGRAWESGRSGSVAIDYATAMEGLAGNRGRSKFATASENTLITYLDSTGRRHQIWLAGAATTYNQMLDARSAGVRNIGIWGLGREDPSLWPLLTEATLDAETALPLLEQVDLSGHVRYSGEGPFLDFTESGAAGRRTVRIDAQTGRVADLRYAALPRPYSVRRWGRPDEKVVALTFDDGPDTAATGPILDILAEAGVTASFFPVGTQMLVERDMVRRVINEGHLVGSHSFSHSQMDQVSDRRIRTELNLQARILASVAGHTPVMFRAPFVRGRGPIAGTIAQKMHMVDQIGYLTLGSEIVPPDWEIESADQITEFIIRSVLDGDGNVILLHDGGGDRSATVEALPAVISGLRAEGYRFVNLDELAGLGRADLMPVEFGSRKVFERYAIAALGGGLSVLKVAFWVVIGLGLFRALVMLTLALRRGRDSTVLPLHRPSVTVLVPAYNEEKVIVRTVRSILASRYRNLSVMVVDDGSTDDTKGVVQREFANDPRVTLLSQRNQGKWKAANTAFGSVTSEIVVAIDADTLVDPEAIGRLVPHFADPDVGAVAGNVMVCNPGNLLTRLQSVEYITAQNIDRRAFETRNAMMVVPGAIGAWRVDAVHDAGLYSAETMTEDADLTVSILRCGYQVRFEERAYTFTEAPETVRAFLAQRLRWSLGMMQTAWKHRRALREQGALGRWTFPDLLIFGVLIPVFAPVVDLVILLALAGIAVDLVQGTPILDGPVSGMVLAGCLVLPVIETIVTVTAFVLEPRASRRLLLVLPMQRIFFRPLLTLTVYRALWRALTGRLASWSKLRRTASVNLAELVKQQPAYALTSETSGSRSR